MSDQMKKTNNLDGILKIFGLLYGFFGLTSLLTFFYVWVFGPTLHELGTKDFFGYLLFPTIALLNATICFLITYSFWRLKNLGRYLVITYNGLWLGSFIFGFIIARITEPNLSSLSMPVILILLLMFIPLGGIIVFCLKPEVKNLMRN